MLPDAEAQARQLLLDQSRNGFDRSGRSRREDITPYSIALSGKFTMRACDGNQQITARFDVGSAARTFRVSARSGCRAEWFNP
jgi:hypothetical protein